MQGVRKAVKREDRIQCTPLLRDSPTLPAVPFTGPPPPHPFCPFPAHTIALPDQAVPGSSGNRWGMMPPFVAALPKWAPTALF